MKNKVMKALGASAIKFLLLAVIGTVLITGAAMLERQIGRIPLAILSGIAVITVVFLAELLAQFRDKT